MTVVFLICAAVMAIAAGLWAVLPLLRQGRARGGVERAETNLAVYRDQLQELDADLRVGTLSQSQYDEARREIDRRVVSEVAGEPQAAQPGPRSGRALALAIVVGVPLAAGFLYWRLGNPDAIEMAASTGGHEVSPQQVEAMVNRLEERLKKNPDQPEAWAMLARSYYHMRRFEDAARAYERIAPLIADDAELLADYADALAMSQGRKIEGKPLELVNRALKVDPAQWKALAMAGTAAFDRGDYSAAVDYWLKLQAQVPPDSDLSRSVSGSIAEARQLAGAKPGVAKKPAAAVAAGVKGTVQLSPALAAKVSPTDTVFVYARAAQGPRMPLAILRRQVKDLPFEFTLDDSQAMSPESRISNFPEVVVHARISKSGGAASQSGDLQGESRPVKIGTTRLKIDIDQVIP